MPHNRKPLEDRERGEGWLVDITPKDKRSNNGKLYKGFLLVSDTRRSDWIVDGHLDLGRFSNLGEAKKAIDKLINRNGK